MGWLHSNLCENLALAPVHLGPRLRRGQEVPRDRGEADAVVGAARRVERAVEDVGGLKQAEAGPRAVEREDDRRRRHRELPVEVVLALDPEDRLRDRRVDGVEGRSTR